MITQDIIDVSLFGISLIVAIVLAVAWYEFERPAHARTWSISFATLSIIWAIELVSHRGFIGDRANREIVVLVAAFASAFNTIGFRQRAGRASWWKPLLATALLPALSLMVMGRGLPGFVSLMPLDLFDAAMLGIAAATLVGRRRSERAAQHLTFIGLTGLATVSGLLFIVKLIALFNGPDPQLEGVGEWLLPLLPATVTAIGIFTIFLLTADLADQTRRLAGTDALTGLLNRRGFEGVAQTVLDTARGGKRRMTLVLIDIDRFKHVNDSFGHPVGDEVLRRFARELAAHAGRRDLLARFGGEEFALLLVDTDMTAAACCAEIIRRAIADLRFDLPDNYAITASFGLADVSPETLLLSDLLARADRALYRAKETGRDRVIAFADSDPKSESSG